MGDFAEIAHGCQVVVRSTDAIRPFHSKPHPVDGECNGDFSPAVLNTLLQESETV